jgi:hypothetical protein
MDSDSDYEKGSLDTPAIPIELLSMESLIKRVDEFQRSNHLEIIERLTVESTLLQNLILKYQKNCMELLERTLQAALKLQEALENCINEGERAKKQYVVHQSSSGWI